MKNISGKKLTGILMGMFALTLIPVSCTDEVAMPLPIINPAQDSIFAPALSSTFRVDVEANCDWTAELETEAESWLSLAGGDVTGRGEVIFSLQPNTSGTVRSTLVELHNSGHTAVSRIYISQNSSSSQGYLPIAALRKAFVSGSVDPEPGKKLRGVVVSSLQTKNFYNRYIAIEDGYGPDDGIAVKVVDEDLFLSPGEEVEISLDGSRFEKNGDGTLLVTPASQGMIERTVSSPIDVTPVKVSIDELHGAAYESMYVSVSGQPSVLDLKKHTLSEGLTLQDEEGHSIDIHIGATCSFATAAMPTGSGSVNGIVGYVDGKLCLMPCSVADIKLDGARFDGGVILPYVMSLMTEGTNHSGRYMDFIENSDFNKTVLVAKDGSGATISVNLNQKSKKFDYWNDNSGHHNLQLASWIDGPSNYILFAITLGEEITDGFRLSFGLGGQKNAPANFEVEYSTDLSTWHSGGSGAKVSIPRNVTFGGGKNYLYYTADVKVASPVVKKDKLYIKLRPSDNVSISGGALSDGYGRIVLHSCVVIDHLPAAEKTPIPSSAIYFEPFDRLDEGVDYRLGDRLSAMINYCGSDISAWRPDAVVGLTGKNVRQRPGYAQIGYVETQTVAQNSYANSVGELVTPPLNAGGTLELSFKAMAYKNMSVFSAGANTAKDINGDITSGVIDIIGGGTIDGASSKTFTGMGYLSFKTFSFTIENATPDTKIRFTSAPLTGEFSRWFIDDISVIK